MRKILISSQFKKDLKRYKNQKSKLDNLEIILNYLRDGLDIPPRYRPHMLSGNFKGHMECHIENDFLLIWFDKKSDEVILVRIGTHSELF